MSGERYLCDELTQLEDNTTDSVCSSHCETCTWQLRPPCRLKVASIHQAEKNYIHYIDVHDV